MAVRSLYRERGSQLWNRTMGILARRDALRKFDMRWLWLLAGVLVLAAAWNVINGIQAASRADTVQVALVPNVKVAQPAVGPIASSLSFTGDVKASAQVNVVPKATGRVERLAVDVGSTVKKGDVIAEIDSALPKAQVAQAQAALDAAQAKYASMQAGSREEQIAQAAASLESAKLKLSAMYDGSREEQIAQAQAALDAAKAKAEQVKAGAKATDLAALQSQVDAANGSLAVAKAQLEKAKQGPTQTQWWQALGQLDVARANMKAAEARLADVKAGPKQADLAAAQAAVVAAQAQLTATDDLHDLYDHRNDLTNGVPVNATMAGSAGATSSETINRKGAAVQAALEAAQAKLDLLRSYPLPADLQAAQSTYDAAKGVYDLWFNAVDQMKRGVTPEDLQQAQGAVTSAEAAAAGAQAKLQTARDGATEDDLIQVNTAVTQAEQALALVQKPFRAQDLAQAQVAVTAAQAQYNLVQNPYTDNDLNLGKAAVNQAQAALDMAQIGLSETQVVSPIDGMVADRLQSVGNLVAPTTPIVVLVSSDVELALLVEESQIGQIKAGQKAELTVPAYPNKEFRAAVTAIAPVADPRSRSFQVKIKPDDPDGNLMQGMFADVKIVTQQKDNALTLPKEAVVTRGGKSGVFVLKDGIVQFREVKLGIQTNTMVEVASGVDPGEQVITAGHADLQDGNEVNTL